MKEEMDEMSKSYCDWIIKEVHDDCLFTGLDFEDHNVRKAIIDGLRGAAEYIERLTHPLH